MVFRSIFSKTQTAVGLIALLLVLPGCPLSPEGDNGGGGDGNDRIPERTSIRGAIDLYAYAWQRKELTLYQQLLHDEFEFVPYSEDGTDFSWIPEDGWGRTVELDIAAHMFDDAFASSETGETIATIEMTLSIQDERTVEGEVLVTTAADILVLSPQSNGHRSDVRFVFTVVGDSDEPGKFQIKRQEELAAF